MFISSLLSPCCPAQRKLLRRIIRRCICYIYVVVFCVPLAVYVHMYVEMYAIVKWHTKVPGANVETLAGIFGSEVMGIG